MTQYFLFFIICILCGCAPKTATDESQEQKIASIAPRWSEQKANDWYKQKRWLVGCNFAPSTAINQLEMWQAETFDTLTIARELTWAQDLGFNSIRVFLHHLLWQDSTAFLQRMDKFLSIADRHDIGVMFVIFDSVWDPFPQSGKQRGPKPHVHNSGWVQSPGVEILKDTSRYDELKPYVTGVIRKFASDPRVHVWDLFNEADNPNKPAYDEYEPTNKGPLSLRLLEKTFRWAREVNPSQPLSAGMWYGDWDDTTTMKPIDKFAIVESDILTFHNYDGPEELERKIKQLKQYNRPVVCTEYMARGNNSTFEGSLPVFEKYNVGAYNWGFVSGKTQTIYPWDSWTKQYTAEPKLWFHDIFYPNGKPYRQMEVKFIKEVTTRVLSD